MKNEQTSLSRVALRSILEINDYSSESAVKLAELALNKSLKITASKYGYIYYYDENTEKLTLYS